MASKSVVTSNDYAEVAQVLAKDFQAPNFSIDLSKDFLLQPANFDEVVEELEHDPTELDDEQKDGQRADTQEEDNQSLPSLGDFDAQDNRSTCSLDDFDTRSEFSSYNPDGLSIPSPSSKRTRDETDNEEHKAKRAKIETDMKGFTCLAESRQDTDRYVYASWQQEPRHVSKHGYLTDTVQRNLIKKLLLKVPDGDEARMAKISEKDNLWMPAKDFVEKFELRQDGAKNPRNKYNLMVIFNYPKNAYVHKSRSQCIDCRRDTRNKFAREFRVNPVFLEVMREIEQDKARRSSTEESAK